MALQGVTLTLWLIYWISSWKNCHPSVNIWPSDSWVTCGEYTIKYRLIDGAKDTVGSKNQSDPECSKDNVLLH